MKIGFAGLLALIFITLKLTGHIAWSWLWVLSPLWIGLAVVLTVSVVAFIIALIVQPTITVRKRK